MTDAALIAAALILKYDVAVVLVYADAVMRPQAKAYAILRRKFFHVAFG